MAVDWAAQQKIVDLYNFVKAEDFFQDLDRVASSGEQASSVKNFSFDRHEALETRQLILNFDNGRALSLRFISPRAWLVRCNYEDRGAPGVEESSKHVIQPTISDLVKVLNVRERIHWDVELVTDEVFLVLQSRVRGSDDTRTVATQLWIQLQPFRISAVQTLETVSQWQGLHRFTSSEKDACVRLQTTPGSRPAVVWQTKERGVRYQGTATILSLEKPSTARYFGWGEQGGRSFAKDKVTMNYFNYDNMEYESVYGNGPLDPREPLYHSDPFWIEANRNPGYRSKTGTFVANYSQICVDLGKTSSSETRVATRFGPADFYVIAEENLSRVIMRYTAIVGRPWLKPRYALGYGQGAYGYDTQHKVKRSAEGYKKSAFPLDTMHIDVDIQEEYRTFTVDTSSKKFPDPKGMFSELKKHGVKCCTNITPFINGEKSESYETLNEMIKNRYFVPDERYLHGTVAGFQDQRYLCYEAGKAVVSDPNVDRPGFKDDYIFKNVFNGGPSIPYHGGVNYGKNLGRSGHYPDLNREEVRYWWGQQYRTLIDLGLEFVWQDMTSPSISKEYGDMKSFPCRLLLSPQIEGQKKQPAIEIWSLYAYNLLKATFKGWNNSKKRKGKRNFIIGRGSFSGMHRFAGLWTGDNAGTWDFLSINVAQALALGLSGMTVVGGDVGGFMPCKEGEKYTDPELLIRWYSACFLLPWFRNHYNGKPGQKLFQEPFRYPEYYDEHSKELGPDQAFIFHAVLTISRYFTRLRYSLMQMLYDAMFENIFTGLPIVNSLAITEIEDESLYLENEPFLSNEYIVRKDLLVAPIVTEQDSSKGWRSVYLPGPDDWFKFNLSCHDPMKEKEEDEDFLGHALSPKLSGGSHLSVEARLQTDSPHLSSITPMYIREGAIIPKQKPRNHVADRTNDRTNIKEEPDPITLHFYPGKDNSYNMYLDDGVSRDSAPRSSFMHSQHAEPDGDLALVADPEASGRYRKVCIRQQTVTGLYTEERKGSAIRKIIIETAHDGYGPEKVARDIGRWYRVVIWHEKPDTVANEVTVRGTTKECHFKPHMDERAMVGYVPVEAENPEKTISIEQRA